MEAIVRLLGSHGDPWGSPAEPEDGMPPPPPPPPNSHGSNGYEDEMLEDEISAAMIQQQAKQFDSDITELEQYAIGFQGYNVETVDPFAGFHHIIIAYCLMAFVLMYPFVICLFSIRENRKRRRVSEMQTTGVKQQQPEADLVSPAGSELPQDGFDRAPSKQISEDQEEVQKTHNSISLPRECHSACSEPSGRFGEKEKPNDESAPVTPTTTKSTLQEEPDKPLPDSSLAMPTVGRTSANVEHSRSSQQHMPNMPQSRQTSQVASSSGIFSRIPSAATTGQLYTGNIRGSTAVWPRHRHSKRPSGDPAWQWRRAIQTERRHINRRMEQILSSQREGGVNPNLTSTSGAFFRLKSSVSDLANTVLSAEQKDLHAHANQQRSSKVSPHQHSTQAASGVESTPYTRNTGVRHRQNSKTQLHQSFRRPSCSGSARSGSIRSWNDGRYGQPGSVMSSVVDDISPNDAADAGDPGKVRIFPSTPDGSSSHHDGHRSPMAAACCRVLEPWLDVAEPNDEWRRLWGLALPVTLGALVEPIARCILMGLISQNIGTHAMVSYLLVHLLYRMSGETLSVAITDAESTLVQMALTTTANNQDNQGNSATFTRQGYSLAGQYVQLACLMQLLVIGTVVILWYFYIEDVVFWWVDSADMASLAKEYFQIILILFMTQAIYRAIMVPCNMRGSEHSKMESTMDIAVTATTLVAVAVVLNKTVEIPREYPDFSNPEPWIEENSTYTTQNRLDDSRTALVTTAWIQVVIGIAACVLKIAFCVLKGWLDHFGVLRSIAVLNFEALCNLLLSSIPLILGALLELGEVDLLTLFVQYLGPAEVAAWAMFGSMFDVLEAATEGISEAAAIRMAYHLSASQPVMAKKAAHKALFWTVVQALIFTSILLLAGRHLIVALTVDFTLQHLLDQLLGLMALGNLSMSFAHVCWSLVGAQGLFSLATLVMLVCRWLVTMPMSLIFIYARAYDEETLAGAIAVGTATSACILASILFSSDWDDVAQELYLQGLLSCDDDDDFDFSFGGEEDSDDDDDSFGARDSGYPSNKKSFDEDDSGELPQSTEPTTRTGTNTGSGVNSGADSGVISGGTVSGMSSS